MKGKAIAVLVGAGVLVATSVAAAAVVVGTSGDDVLRGTNRSDRISAFAGNDLVDARGGADDVRVGA